VTWATDERTATYRATGRVYREADELFTRISWLAVMDGQRLRAAGFDPLAQAMPLAEARERMARIAGVTQAVADRMTAHGDFIARHCAAVVARPN
jgi:tryptophan halogenase